MASHFDRWEKDPFFSAAEEVQESADRMESTYRTWIHATKDASSMWNSEELRRDLRTALGTTKWQLEEFERAVKSSYSDSSSEDAKERHREFASAMKSQISKIESSLHASSVSNGKPPLPWVRLDEGECNELALFLSGPSMHVDKTLANVHVNQQKTDKQLAQDCSKNSRHSVEDREEKSPGHRRTASAGADIGVWKIAVADDVLLPNGHPGPPPRKVPSLGLLNTMETVSKFKWPKNGYRKLKNADHHQETEPTLPQSQQVTRT